MVSSRAMSDRDRPSLRDELQRRLFGLGSKLPTSSLGRMGRTAMAALRGGLLARRGAKDGAGPLDVESLTALVASVGQLKGIAMKIGQMMSYLELPLPPEVRAALAVLQTHSPPMPFERVRAVITAELGDHAAALLDGLEPEPVAAASLGQVHRGRLPDGTRVAVKVQYPEIPKAIVADFRPAALGTRFVDLIAPGAQVQAIISAARDAMLDECDYEREAACQERFGAIYAGHATLAVPAVERAWCARRVLTTRWCDGARFDDFLASRPSQAVRDRLGEALFEFYIGTIYRHRLYNWDPHPGNYIVAPDGSRITMLDYGSTRVLEAPLVRALAALAPAAQSDDAAALRAALVALGLIRHDDDAGFAVARSLVRSFYGPMLRDEVAAIAPAEARPLASFLGGKRELLKLQLPGELLFLLRIRFGVLSVLAQLGARANWYRLERHFAADA
jgi:predicted unusual protein kinase regulating ubiquinone biosynthesis (AarF/ABC1/UbiB family)